METRTEVIIEEFELKHPPEFKSQSYKVDFYKSEMNRIRDFLALGINEGFLSPNEIQILISRLEKASIRIRELRRSGY